MRLWGWGLAAVLLAVLTIARVPGALGLGLGVLTGLFSAFVLYHTVRLLPQAQRTTNGMLFILVGFGVKFPLLALGAYFSLFEGVRGLACFVFGLVVVYSGLVWRAARSDLYSR